MKIKLIAFEDGLVSMGLRRVSSYTKKFHDDVETFFYNVEGNSAFIKNLFFQNRNRETPLNKSFIDRVKDADVIGVSCMSVFSPLVIRFIKEIKAKNPSCYIVWGGSHAIMDPDDCLKYADAVCVGQEGEKIFVELIDKFHSPEREKINGFWFKNGADLIKNPQSALLTPEELDSFPYQDFSNEVMYVDSETMKPTDRKTYLNVQGTKYTTIWSIGCPYQCSYCGNTKFLENDIKYARARYQKPETIIDELIQFIGKYDFISFIEFQDDNFFLIKDEDILQFAKLYKEHIGIPFFIPGIFPGVIRDETILDALIDAGMAKARMGIQSGSQKTLKMFQRPTRHDKIVETANMLISKHPKLSPPFFDIIIDIPTEDDKDKEETISLLQSLKRPFFLYIYSLRVIPNTNLFEYSQQHPEMDFLPIQESYGYTFDKKYSLQLHLIALGASHKIVNWISKGVSKTHPTLPFVLVFTKLLYFGRRFFNELRFANLMPICVLFPGLPWFLYQWGILKRKKV